MKPQETTEREQLALRKGYGEKLLQHEERRLDILNASAKIEALLARARPSKDRTPLTDEEKATFREMRAADERGELRTYTHAEVMEQASEFHALVRQACRVYRGIPLDVDDRWDDLSDAYKADWQRVAAMFSDHARSKVDTEKDLQAFLARKALERVHEYEAELLKAKQEAEMARLKLGIAEATS